MRDERQKGRKATLEDCIYAAEEYAEWHTQYHIHEQKQFSMFKTTRIPTNGVQGCYVVLFWTVKPVIMGKNLTDFVPRPQLRISETSALNCLNITICIISTFWEWRIVQYCSLVVALAHGICINFHFRVLPISCRTRATDVKPINNRSDVWRGARLRERRRGANEQ